MSTFSLLKVRYFSPYFFTQFFGAFNDNIFKNYLIIMITYQIIDADVNMLTNLSAALFILPFFIFSASAGQIADKYEKAWLIRSLKAFEIAIMGLAAVGFYSQNINLLMTVLFLMGTQSAFFGPVKYGILPQHLPAKELVAGNALVEMGTFLAILLGTLAGGLLLGLEGTSAISMIVLLIAVAGYACSRAIPPAPGLAPDLRINPNPFSETMKNLCLAAQHKTLFLSMLGISWFWFLGAAYLTQLPNFTLTTLQANQQVVTVLLSVFSIGIGAGSILCDALSDEQVEIGLVPLGSIGLTLFGIDFCWAQTAIIASTSVADFLAQWGSWHLLFDLLMIGVFGGFYIVPLYAMIQQRSPESHRSRMIAANNILNALFMVVSAVVAMLCLGLLGMSISQFFLVVAVLNALVAAYIYTLTPEFLMRFIVWLLVHSIYRVSKHLGPIPQEGGALLVCNHVSYVDPLIIAACCPRPIRFVVHASFFHMPVLGFVLRTANAIPINEAEANREVLRTAHQSISDALAQGELVCYFPEGRLTDNGALQAFQSGVEHIMRHHHVPVVPLALVGLWESIFSNNPNTHGIAYALRRLFSPVELRSAAAIDDASRCSASTLQIAVEGLLTDKKGKR
ncbi:MAG: MFS transporter [Mariprofundaceae bacterium]|nr:MFS transporter [Mariprofundaceae bacterium]